VAGEGLAAPMRLGESVPAQTPALPQARVKYRCCDTERAQSVATHSYVARDVLPRLSPLPHPQVVRRAGPPVGVVGLRGEGVPLRCPVWPSCRALWWRKTRGYPNTLPPARAT
jgi:hypothetical protein